MTLKQQLDYLSERVTLNCVGCEFYLIIEQDKKDKRPEARFYIQIGYVSECTKTSKPEEWKGRKWYLSEHMTNDEIIKTMYAAFEAAVKHEIMEGFKIDGKIIFNPHIDFEELLKISEREITRTK